MTTKKNTNLFQKGKSGNKNGRPKTALGKGKPISRLRSTLNKLKLLEQDAIEAIEATLKGGVENSDGVVIEADKDKTDIAKWIITSISSLTRTAIAEESYRADLQDKAIPAKATGTNDSTSKPVRFTTHIIQDED